MADRYCGRCGTALPADALFCGRCGSPVFDPGFRAGPPHPIPTPARYYASRYLSDGIVYVQEQNGWWSLAPGGASGGGTGQIPEWTLSKLVEIRPEEARRIIDTRLREASRSEPALIYAGFWRRFAALLIDGAVVGGATSVVSYMFVGAMVATGSEEATVTSVLVTILIDLVARWLYFTLLEASKTQASVGKMALGIVVTDMQLRRISWGRANARYWAKILSALILMVGFLMAGFTEKKQALHDIIAGTLVVEKEGYF